MSGAVQKKHSGNVPDAWYIRANFLPLREEFGSLKENVVKRLPDLEKENL